MNPPSVSPDRPRKAPAASPREVHASVARTRRLWPLAVVIFLQVAVPAVRSAEEDSFALRVKPFLRQYCQRCHNAEKRTSGIRVDHLDAAVGDGQVRLWGAIRKQVASDAMPPEDEPQPPAAERQRVNEWITRALEVARSRPMPKNGGMRRLTVAQYRNTLRELLRLEDDLGKSKGSGIKKGTDPLLGSTPVGRDRDGKDRGNRIQTESVAPRSGVGSKSRCGPVRTPAWPTSPTTSSPGREWTRRGADLRRNSLADHLEGDRINPRATGPDESQSVVDPGRIPGDIPDRLEHAPFAGRDRPVRHVILEVQGSWAESVLLDA
jgi:hypothetical protein